MIAPWWDERERGREGFENLQFRKRLQSLGVKCIKSVIRNVQKLNGSVRLNRVQKLQTESTEIHVLHRWVDVNEFESELGSKQFQPSIVVISTRFFSGPPIRSSTLIY